MKNLCHLTAYEIREGYKNRAFSVTDIAKAVVAQVEKLSPKIKAFLYFDADEILNRARDLESQAQRFEHNPMFGIPIAVKDNISIRGIPTTCGSRILEGYKPVYDASVISSLKNQGALIIGKTNMDEFAMGSSTENSAFGPTLNPWDLERVPGGSSGGSAAAVASRVVPPAVGSDTGGSIRQPAAFTGILGLKCTYGLVSRYGLIAYASSLDQIGPMGRSVEDLAMCLEAISFREKRDSTSLDDPLGTKYLDNFKTNVKGLKIGVPKEFFNEGINPDMRESVYQVLKDLEALGAIVEEFSLRYISCSLPSYYIIAPAEASSNLARYDAIRYGLRVPGENIIQQYENTRGAGFGAEVKRRILLGTFVLSAGYYDAYYLKAMKVRRLIKNELTEAFRKYDFLVTPTTPTTAFKIGEKTQNPLEMYLSDICTIGVNLAGIPAISIPCGKIDDLPAGVQFMGPQFSERRLLSLSKAYLDATGHHQIIPSLLKEN